MFHIFIIVGESGSGKTTLQGMLENIGYNIAKGYVTRPMREGERQGDPYNFIKRKSFQDKIYAKDMAEFVEIEGHFYGKSIREFDMNNINITICEPRGMEALQNYFGKNNTTAIYLCTPEDLRIKRMFETRSKESVEKRLETDKTMFRNLFQITDYKIDSGTREENLVEMLSIIQEVMEEKREANV